MLLNVAFNNDPKFKKDFINEQRTIRKNKVKFVYVLTKVKIQVEYIVDIL